MNSPDNLIRPKRVLSATANKIMLYITDDYGTEEVYWSAVTHVIAGRMKKKSIPHVMVFFVKNYTEAFLIESSSFNFKSFLSKTVTRRDQKFLQLIKTFSQSSVKAFIDWPLRDAVKGEVLNFLPEFDDQSALLSYCQGIRNNDKFQEKKENSEESDDSKAVLFNRRLDMLKIRRENSKARLIKAKDIAARGTDTDEYEFSLAKACKEVDDALEMDPGFIDGWLFKADICSQLGRVNNTLDSLKAVTDRIPETTIEEVLSLDIYIHMADLYSELGDSKKECEMLQNYCCISPSKDMDEEILSDLSAALGAPDNEWYESYVYSFDLYKKGNFLGASESFGNVLTDVKARWGFHWLALCYEGMGNHLQAEHLFKLANQIYPAYATYMELGFLYEGLEKFPEAHDSFRQATEFRPSCPFAYISAAQNVIEHLNDEVSAFNMIMKAIEADPYGPFISHAEELIEELQQSASKSAKLMNEIRNKKIGDCFDNVYDIVEIFKGGMGIVFIVTDRDTGKKYAMKTFQDKFIWNDSVVKMFYHEAEIWIRLGVHQNIVQAIKVKDYDGKPYVFLEYIEGTDLEAILKYRQLDIEQIMDYALQFCSGMAYAYRTLGVVHQDIKPSNCMITKDGILKITDFGLGKIYSEGSDEKEDEAMESIKIHRKAISDILPADLANSRSSNLLLPDSSIMDIDLADMKSSSPDIGESDDMNSRIGGTIPYMAPELFTAEKPASTLTDIYSFGAMLYEMITGATPFDGSDAESCIVGHLEEIPEDPLKKRPDIPRKLADVALKCLEKNSDDRYADFSEIFAALTEISKEIGLDGSALDGTSNGAYDTLEKMIYRGESLMVLEKYAEAAELFTRTLQAYPMAYTAMTERAECYRVLGKYNEALKDLKTSIKYDKNNAKVYYYMGLLCLSTKRFKEAHGYFYTSSKLNPSFVDVWLKLGFMYDLVGDGKMALKYYDNALKVNSRCSVAWNNKGNIMMNSNKYFDALSCYTKAIESNPRYQPAWLNQGCAKQKLNLHFDAIKSFKKSLELNPKSSKAMIGICVSLIKVRAYSEAYNYFEAITDLTQQNSYVNYIKSICCYEGKKFREALENAKKAVTEDPNNLVTARNLLFMYLKLHKYEDGLKTIESMPEKIRGDKDVALFLELFRERAERAERFADFTEIWFTEPAIREFRQGHASGSYRVLEFNKSLLEKTGGNGIIETRTALMKRIMEGDESAECTGGKMFLPEWKMPDTEREAKIYSEIRKLFGTNKKGSIRDMFGLDGAYKKARECMAEGDYIKAAQHLQKLLNAAWDEIDIWYYAAVCMHEIGDMDNALEMTAQGIARNPLDIRFWLFRAFLEKKAGDRMTSLNTFALILAMFPSCNEALLEVITIIHGSGLKRLAGETASMFLTFLERMSLENSTSLFYSAFLYLTMGRIDKAKETLDSFLSFYPSSTDAAFLHVYIDIASDNCESARNRMLCIRENDEEKSGGNTFVENLTSLITGYLNIMDEQYDLACEELSKITPDFEAYHLALYYKTTAMSKRSSQGVDLKAMAASILSENTGSSVIWELQAIVQSGDKKSWTDAIWSYSKAMELDPLSTTAAINSGIIMFKLGKLQEAEAFFEGILKNEPCNGKAMLLKIAVMITAEKYEEALPLLDRLLCLEQRSSLAILCKAIALFKTGKIKESADFIEKAFDIEPENPEIWNARGIIMRASDRPNDEIFSYNRAIELDKNCTSACINKAIWLMEMKRYSEAKSLFDRVIGNNPEMAIAWRESGECQCREGQHRDALRCYDLAIKLAPYDYEAYNGKAESTILLGNKPDDAIWLLQRSLELKENQGAIWNNLGTVLVKSGRYEQAYKAFQKAYEQEDMYDTSIYNLILLSMELGKKEDTEVYTQRFYEVESGLSYPKLGESQYLETPYRKRLMPFALIDFTNYFDMATRDLPILLPKTGEYLRTRKNLMQ